MLLSSHQILDHPLGGIVLELFKVGINPIVLRENPPVGQTHMTQAILQHGIKLLPAHITGILPAL
jgi:hypothetical protein